MKYKKIIFIHLLNSYTGSPKVLSQVIKAVEKKGVEVDLFSGKGADGFLSNVTENHNFYLYKRYNNKYLTLASFIFSQIDLFFKLLKYRNENVLIYVNALLPFGAGLAGKMMNKTVLYHVHESTIEPVIFKRFLRYITQKTADRIIFVSKFLEKQEPFTKIKQSVVYNALPNDFLNVAKLNDYHWQKNGMFNVLMACSLKSYKGVKEFVQIASNLERYEHISFTLILSAPKDEIDTFFKMIQIPKNIILISYQTDIIPYYKQASLVLNLSRINECVETFGLTIIEAMAFGIPVIVPPVGGPTEIVHHDEEGYLISSYETEKIAKTIFKLSNDELLCLKLSRAARKRSQHFNEKRFETEILNVINNYNKGKND